MAFSEPKSNRHLVKPVVALDNLNQVEDFADQQQIGILVRGWIGSFGAWKELLDQRDAGLN